MTEHSKTFLFYVAVVKKIKHEIIIKVYTNLKGLFRLEDEERGGGSKIGSLAMFLLHPL